MPSRLAAGSLPKRTRSKADDYSPPAKDVARLGLRPRDRGPRIVCTPRASHAHRQGNRHPRPELPAPDPAGQEGAERAGQRPTAEGGGDRSGIAARLPGLRQTDGERAGRAAAGGRGTDPRAASPLRPPAGRPGAQALTVLRYSRNSAPTSACLSAKSTVASRK